MTERHTIGQYQDVVGHAVIDEIERLAACVRGQRIVTVNSTAVGGGVAEILNRMVPLLEGLGIDVHWKVIRGDERFFEVTKAFHNALHGADCELTERMIRVFEDCTDSNLEHLNLDGDIVFIHDPQPMGLVKARKDGQRWLWRCHIDVSSPNPQFWSYVMETVRRYDAVVFSASLFSQKLEIPQYLIAPSIDPLADKNRELPPEYIGEVRDRFGLDPGRPIITQISRFDHLKDPLGVIDSYRLVKRYHDCQLVLAGGGADDDPEGSRVIEEVRERAGGDADIHVIVLPPDSHLEINALQRMSTVLVQKSLREGFALTVSEGLWKGKPVVASAVGGIPLQVIDEVTGLLVHTVEGCAHAIRRLLVNPALGERLAAQGKEHVRQNFLLTRHLRDYLLTFLAAKHPGETVVNLPAA